MEKNIKNTGKKFKSADLISYVRTVIGLALFVILLCFGFLLYFNYGLSERFYLFILHVASVILFFYVFCCSIISKRIRSAFLPIEENLQKTLDENKSLYNQLEDKINEMDEIYKREASLSDSFEGAKADYNRTKEASLSYAGELRRLINDENEVFEDILTVSESLKKSKNGYLQDAEALSSVIKNMIAGNNDIISDMDEVAEAYKVLSENLDNIVNLTENIFSNLSGITAGCSQLQLYTMNLSLEISRNGARSLSAITASDEIKKISSSISAKADEIALMIIQAKNSASLSIDQAMYSYDAFAQNSKAFKNSMDDMYSLGSKISKVTGMIDYFCDNIGAVSGFVYKIKSYSDNQMKYISYIEDNLMIQEDTSPTREKGN